MMHFGSRYLTVRLDSRYVHYPARRGDRRCTRCCVASLAGVQMDCAGCAALCFDLHNDVETFVIGRQASETEDRRVCGRSKWSLTVRPALCWCAKIVRVVGAVLHGWHHYSRAWLDSIAAYEMSKTIRGI
jgi:hypothetical protein